MPGTGWSLRETGQRTGYPICSPEIAEGGIYTRADWILRNASDISRIDVLRGGITGVMKLAGMCEAVGMRCELAHERVRQYPGPRRHKRRRVEYYERGLLRAWVRYDTPPPTSRPPVIR